MADLTGGQPPAVTSPGELGRITTDLWNYVNGLFGEGYQNKMTTEAALQIANYLTTGGNDPEVVTQIIADNSGGLHNDSRVSQGDTKKADRAYVTKIAQGVISTFSPVLRIATPSQPTTPTTTITATEQPKAEQPKEETTEEMTKRLLDERSTLIDQISAITEEQSLKNYEEQAGAAKGQTIRQLAGAGKLYQPTSAYTLGKLEEQRQKSIGDILAQVQSQKLAGKLNLASDIAPTVIQAKQYEGNLGLQKATLAEQINQFQQNLAYQKWADELAAETAKAVGQAQAAGKKPSTLDYATTAITGLGTLGTLASAYGTYQTNKQNAQAQQAWYNWMKDYMNQNKQKTSSSNKFNLGNENILG